MASMNQKWDGMVHQFQQAPSYYPSMNLVHQQGPPDFGMQHGIPPMNCMPPAMYGAPAQFVPPPMYSPEANMIPYNRTVPPPGFEQNMAYGHNSNYSAPSATGYSFNPQIPDSPQFLTIPMQPFPLFIPSERLPNQRRPKAIPIIDPATGMDKLNEIYGPATSSDASNNSDTTEE